MSKKKQTRRKKRGSRSSRGRCSLLPYASASAFRLGFFARYAGTDCVADCLLELDHVIRPAIIQGLFHAIRQIESTFQIEELRRELTADRSDRLGGIPDTLGTIRLVDWANRAIPSSSVLHAWYGLGAALGDLGLAQQESLNAASCWQRLATAISTLPRSFVQDNPTLMLVSSVAESAPRETEMPLLIALQTDDEFSEYVASIEYRRCGGWLPVVADCIAGIIAANSSSERASVASEEVDPVARDIPPASATITLAVSAVRLSPMEKCVLAVLLDDGIPMTGERIMQVIEQRLDRSVGDSNIRNILASMVKFGLLDNLRDTRPPGYRLADPGHTLALHVGALDQCIDALRRTSRK